MIVLSYDTSLAACSAAIVDVGTNARVLSASYCEPGKGHAEILLGIIGDVMSEAGVDFEDINRQVVTRGPGSFTGVRVALSAARGFRLAHNMPICSVSSMQAISANISKNKPAASAFPIAVIIDARRQQVYGQVFDVSLKPLCQPALIAVDELGSWMEPWNNMPLTIMGTGADLIKAMPENHVVVSDHTLPDAACFGLAFSSMVPDDTSAEPLYLRKPDAKPQIIGQNRA